MKQEGEFSYAAFISYSHRDKKQAKWLQKKLETYEIPKELQMDLGVSRKLKKCFRDEDDLSGTSLQEAIYKELLKSEYLIVVCSKHTTKSHYVNEEIKKFCEIRGREFIIPFIIDGNPEECFPEALVEAYKGEDTPLGYDIRELGKWKVISKIVATILGLSADFLLKRDEKKRKKQIYTRSGMALVASVVLIYTLCYVIYCWPDKEYYVDYVMQQGVPIGIGELTNQELNEKSSHYCIITKNTPEGFTFWNGATTFEIRYENVEGTLIEESVKVDQASWIICTFSNDGQYTMVLKDENEVEFATLNYTKDMLAMDITNPLADSQAVVLSADTMSDIFGLDDDYMTYGNISRKYYTYDENGFVIRVEYMRDNRNTPVADSNGIYGEEYVLDDKGRIVETYFLDMNGERFSLSTGLYCVETIYNEADLLVTENGYMQDGTPTYITDEKVVVVREYDDNMNCISRSYTDLEGNLKYNDNNYAKIVFYYTDGLCSLYQYYSIKDEIFELSGTYAQVELEYDKNGRIIKEVKLDKEGSNEDKDWSVTIREIEYDSKGNITKLSFFNADGSPYDISGVHIIEREYNADGYCIMKANRDSESDLIDSGLDYAMTEYIYQDGVLKEQSSYDSEMTLASRIVFQYDTQTGNIEEIQYCDENGDLTTYVYNYAIERYEYDENGHITKKSYYDTDNQLIASDIGYAYCIGEYDDVGNCIMISYYDETEQLVDSFWSISSINSASATRSSIEEAGFYAIIEVEYDEWGNVIQQKCYSKEGTLRTDGVAICNVTYDSTQNVTSVEYRDENEELVENGGYAKACYEYDALGQCTKVYYYGEDNALLESDDNPYTDECPIIEYTYDENGNCTKEAYYDSAEQPMQLYEGYSSISYAYDEAGNCIEEVFYDATNQLVQPLYKSYAKLEKSYDLSGNVLRESYYDEDNNLVIQESSWSQSGYAEKEYIYEEGYCIEEIYYDENGQRVLTSGTKGDYSRKVKVYEEGKCVEEIYYDEKDELIEQLGGYAIIKYQYDESAFCVETTYYDKNNQLVEVNGMYASILAEYHEEYYWLETKISYCDKNAQLIDQEDGYAMISYTYDEDGKCIEESYYNQEEELVSVTLLYDTGTYAIIKKEYDDSGNCTMKAYYDEENMLCLQEDGYAVIRYEYNQYGECTKTSYYDEDDAPVAITTYLGSYASVEKEYKGSSYQCIKESYYDENGEPCIQRTYDGVEYVSMEKVYYDSNAIETIYFNKEGNII